MKCHRLGCNNPAKTGIRDKNKDVLVFCPECFNYLVMHGVIDSYSKETMTS